MNDAGTAGWHEPPYTWEEEMEFYRRVNAGMASGQATIYRGSPAAAVGPAQPKQPPQEEQDGAS